MRRLTFVFLFLLGTLSLPSVTRAQNTGPVFAEDAGYLNVRKDLADWPSPESVANDLRSDDDQQRLKALYLFGLTDLQTHRAVWSSGKVTGQSVVTPDPIQVTYAALGEGATRQAIIALQVPEMQLAFAAVATPTAKGWTRIAVFDCWCKYDLSMGTDALSQFIQLQPVLQPGSGSPMHFELVLRASGGGTGIYHQNEAHYRMHEGELRRVLSFESRVFACQTGGPDRSCAIERRWFYPQWYGNNESGGFLVYGQEKVTAGPINWFVRDLEIRNLRTLRCTPYKWDEQTFRYEERKLMPGEKDPCQGE